MKLFSHPGSGPVRGGDYPHNYIPTDYSRSKVWQHTQTPGSIAMVVFAKTKKALTSGDSKDRLVRYFEEQALI